MRARSLACVKGYSAFHVRRPFAIQWWFLATQADMLVKAATGGLAQEKSRYAIRASYGATQERISEFSSMYAQANPPVRTASTTSKGKGGGGMTGPCLTNSL